MIGFLSRFPTLFSLRVVCCALSFHCITIHGSSSYIWHFDLIHIVVKHQHNSSHASYETLYSIR
jgi:hypothetical protein